MTRVSGNTYSGYASSPAYPKPQPQSYPRQQPFLRLTPSYQPRSLPNQTLESWETFMRKKYEDMNLEIQKLRKENDNLRRKIDGFSNRTSQILDNVQIGMPYCLFKMKYKRISICLDLKQRKQRDSNINTILEKLEEITKKQETAGMKFLFLIWFMYIYIYYLYLDLKQTTPKELDPNIHKILEILEELKKQGGERPPAEDSLLKYHQEHQTFKAVVSHSLE